MVTAKDAKVVVSLDFQANGQSLGRAVRDIEKNLNALQRKSALVGKSMAGIVPSFAATGAAAFSAYKFATSAAMQFEDSFAGIKKTLNFTEGAAVSAEKKFKNLSEEIRDIAKTTPIAANELNKIGEIGGQLGIQASQIGKFVDTISKLTVATNMGAEDAAFAISRLANITGTAEKDIDNLASTLVRLGNEFAATESEIVNTALGIATAMEALESPVTNAAVDAMALATALKAVGVQSQSGATAVQRALDVMGKAVTGGGKELATFAKISGLTVTGFEQLALVDPAKAFLAFLNGLRDISDSGGDTIVMLEQLGLSQQRTVRALRALAFASDDVERALKSANEEFVINNALNSEAEKRYETTTSQIGILRNNITDIGIALGSETLPALNRLIGGFTTIAKAKTADDLKKLIKQIGIFTVGLNVLVQALKNVQANLSLMPGAGKQGQGAFFADFFKGGKGAATANAGAQIEMLRADFLKTLENQYKFEMEHLPAYQKPAMTKEYERLLTSASDGNMQFLGENNLDGSSKAFLGTNRDTLLSVMQSQGMDTKETDAIIRRASQEGVDVFKDTSMYDMDNLDDFQKKHINFQDQVKSSISDQIVENQKLNELTSLRNEILQEGAQIADNDARITSETIQEREKLNIEIDNTNQLIAEEKDALKKNNDLLIEAQENTDKYNQMTELERKRVDKAMADAEKHLEDVTQKKFDIQKEIAVLEDKQAKGKATDADKEELSLKKEQSKELSSQIDSAKERVEIESKKLPTDEKVLKNLKETNTEHNKRIKDLNSELGLLKLRQKLIEGDDTGLKKREAAIKKRGRQDAIESEVLAAATGFDVGSQDQQLFKEVQVQKKIFEEMSESFYKLNQEFVKLTNLSKEGLATPEQLNRLQEVTQQLQAQDPLVKEQREKYLNLQKTLDENLSSTENYVKLLKTFEESVMGGDITGGEKISKTFEDINTNVLKDFNLEKAVDNLDNFISSIDENTGRLKDRLSETASEITELERVNSRLNEDIERAGTDPTRTVDEGAFDTIVENEKKINDLKELQLNIDDKLALNNDRRAKADEQRIRYNSRLNEIKENAKADFFAEDDKGVLIGQMKKIQELENTIGELDAAINGATRAKNAFNDEFEARPDTQADRKLIEDLKQQKQGLIDSKNASRDKTAQIIKDAKLEIQKQEQIIENNQLLVDSAKEQLDEGLIKDKDKKRVESTILDNEKEISEATKQIENEKNKITDATNSKKTKQLSLDKQINQINDKILEKETAIDTAKAKQNKNSEEVVKLTKEREDAQKNLKKLVDGTMTAEEYEREAIETFNREENKRLKEKAKLRGEGVKKLESELFELHEITTAEQQAGNSIKANNDLREMQAKKLKVINGLIKQQVKDGKLTDVQAQSILTMIDTGQIGPIINELGEVQEIAEIFEKSGVKAKGAFKNIINDNDLTKMQKFKRLMATGFRVDPKVGEGITEIKKEIDKVGTGLFGAGNKLKGFAKTMENTGTKTGAVFGKLTRGVAKGVKFLGLFGKNMDLINTKFVTNNKLTPQMIRMMTKLTMVVRGVTAALMGLIANLGIMAAFSAAMTLFFKFSENANKSEAAIQGVRGALDDLFGDRQSLVGQQESVKVLEDLLDEYKNKGKEFEDVVTAIEDRLEESNKNLIKQEIEYNKKLGEIVQESLFDSKVLFKNADPQKFLSAIGELAGTTIDNRGTRELFFDDLFQGIGSQLSNIATQGRITPRDILESFMDVNAFEKTSRDIFGVLLEGIDDTYNLIYDIPSDGSRNFFSVSQKNLVDFVREFELSNQKLFGGDTILSRDADKEGYFDSKGFDTYTKALESNIQNAASQLEVSLGADFIKIDKVTALGFRDELANITTESVARFLKETDGALSAADLQAGQIFLDNLIGGLQKDGTEQFKKDLVTMFASGNVIIEQAFQEMSDGKSLIAEIQTQAMLAEMKQLQNEGFIGTIVDPAKNFAKARAQLQAARNQLIAEEQANAQKIREELDLAELELDKFNQTLTENFNKVRQTLSNVFQDMPVQVKKSIKRITEELMVKGALQRNFENMIKRLATFAPVLAEQLSKEGPKVAQIVKNFLNDRTMAQVAESGLINLFPEGASEIGVKADELEKLKKNGLEIGSAMADGILLGLHNRGQIALPNSLVMLLNDTVQAGVDAMGIRSPSKVTMKLVGEPMIEGIVSALAKPEVIKKALQNTLNRAIIEVEAYVEEFDKYFYATFNQAADEIKTAMDALFGFTQAQRDLVQANYAVQKSEQALMATRREQASFSDRFLANQKELQRLSIEGRKGNITGSEELSILKQKVALQDMLDKAQGNRSARERLAIAQAEEDLDKLKLAAQAGIVSALEVDAAQEALDEMKGDNLSEDEQRIAVLELAEANKELQNTEDKAKETSQELISAQQTHIQLMDEQANQSYELETAYDNLEAALEGVYTAEHTYEKARDKFSEFVASSPELFDKLIEGYGGVGSHIDGVVQKTKNLATQTVTSMDTAIDKVREYLHELARADAENMLEYKPSTLTKGQTLAQAKFNNFDEFLRASGLAGTQTGGLLKTRAQTGMVGAERDEAYGQFKDDTELNLAVNAANKLITASDEGVLDKTGGRRYEFVRAMEGLLGVPITLFESGQYGTSEEALKNQGLEYLIPELANRGFLIFDTSQKLKEYEEDFSRDEISGVRQAGYNPNLAKQSYGANTKTYKATDLSIVRDVVKAYSNMTQNPNLPTTIQELLNQSGFSNSGQAQSFYSQMVSKVGTNMNAVDKRNVDNYFQRLAGSIDSYLKMIGMTNTAVVKGFKYGGNVKPFQRALIGEYGPEFVQALPGGGLRVTPQGSDAGSSMVVENLNVQVTGVPSDPIQARKAAQQIQKALVNLQKEGSTGAGLRRN